MWWYACSTAPWMFLGPVMMMIFILACVAMMFFLMRSRDGFGAAPANGESAVQFGPWRNLASKDNQPSTAFGQYREETLRRLEREQTEFKSFLDQLRSAKDKVEFDQFMAERQSAARTSD